MADSEAIDLYADVDDFGPTAAAPMDQAMDGIESDLYDAMITSSAEGTEETNSDVIVDRQELIQERRCPLYVGNLTWWTSDQDLIDVISSSGVTDIIEIKFHENRTNGQSKGYATVIVGSESSMNTLITKLPKKELHGKTLIVTLCTKQNQKLFDDAAPAKQKATNGDEFASGDQSGVAVPSSSMHRTNRHYFQRAVPSSNMPSPSTASQGMMVYPPHSSPCPSASPRLHVLPHPSMMMMPGGPGVVMRGPPPSSGIHGPPGMVIHQRPDWNMGPVNAFQQRSSFSRDGHLSSYRPYYDQAQSLGMSGRQTSDRFRKSHHSAYHRRDAVMPQISETEFEEVLQKNRNISSGAITRANEDAAAGDFPGAIETLVTAISLIWQSKIAEDERCKTLISALQDTLQGIEQRSYATKTLHDRRSRSRNHSDSDSDDQNSKRRSRSRSRHRSPSQNCTDNKGSNHSSRENSRSRDCGSTQSQRNHGDDERDMPKS